MSSSSRGTEGSRTGAADTTSSSSSDPTTSVVLNAQRRPPAKNADHEDPASPPSSSSSSSLTSSPSISKSSTDISSEILASIQNDQERSPCDPPTSHAHGHLLPSGWSCRYLPNTDEYSFEYSNDATPTRTGPAEKPGGPPADVGTPTRDDTAQTSRRPTLHTFECNYGYHFPTSPTSSMISQLAKQVQDSSAPGRGQKTAPKTRQLGYGKHKLVIPTYEAEQCRRLHDMFPTATQPIIEQMVRIYHGREGLIKAALISLGYKRATEYSVQQASSQSPIMLMMSKPASKKLFDKLVGYFPDKDETLIKNLMYRHKEVEHEIISALVESAQDSSAGISPTTRSQIDRHIRQSDRNGAIMKLRYLKFLYPSCEEIELYHLLNCNDLNAQRVMELVEKRGHKRINIEEVLQSRKSQAQQMRAQQAAYAAKDKPAASASELVEAHLKRPKPSVLDARKTNLLASLRKTFADLDEGLGLNALEAADFNEGLARKFIEERAPVDEALFKQRYQLPLDTRPDVVAFPCKSIQKGDTSFMSIVANESVHIDRAVVECDTALALLKVDASTFTQEDFPRQKFTHRLGNQAALRLGPAVQQRQAMVHRESLRAGPRSGLRCGSHYEEVCRDEARPKPNSRALGRQAPLARGHSAGLACGRNSGLVRREHPFFGAPVR